MNAQKTFFSYSRDDSEFVLKLAKDLRAASVNVWLDQLRYSRRFALGYIDPGGIGAGHATLALFFTRG